MNTVTSKFVNMYQIVRGFLLSLCLENVPVVDNSSGSYKCYHGLTLCVLCFVVIVYYIAITSCTIAQLYRSFAIEHVFIKN
jgi:hypothetical protein